MVKVASNIIYDEACMTMDSKNVPLSARTLQILGYESESTIHRADPTTTSLQIQRLHQDAMIPTQATDASVGFDLYAHIPHSVDILPGDMITIPTGIAMAPPVGTYIRIAPRSGLTANQYLTTMAGVIDPDYRGDVKILLHNFGNETRTILPNSKIAQAIIEKVDVPTLEIVEQLSSTNRGNKGFGSSDCYHSPSASITNIDYDATKPAKLAIMTLNDPLCQRWPPPTRPPLLHYIS